MPAFATGQADGSLTIRPLNLGENPFSNGDILITSGNGGLYPPNIPVATIVDKINDSGKAMPIADPATTDYSMVLEIYEPEARELLQEIVEEADTEEEGAL